MKAATVQLRLHFRSVRISIHAAREGGDFDHRHSLPRKGISIHAAREGGDEDLGGLVNHVFISIHAAREGGDLVRGRRISFIAFQSTPPVKAATR